MHELIPLNLLAPGVQAEVDRVVGTCDHVHRLEELGLRGGVAIEMVQSGTPCIVQLGSQKLCFRADDMIRVLVRLHRGGDLERAG